MFEGQRVPGFQPFVFNFGNVLESSFHDLMSVQIN
jgi:hypothetical protein